MQRFLCATALLLLALLAVATGQAQQGNATAPPPPPPPGAGGFDPSALAGLLPGLPPGSCEPYNPNAIVLSQCNRVIAWPAVYVFQGLNQSTADFIAYNATFQALYKVLPENCTAAVMRLTCIQLFLPCAVFPIPIGPPPTPPFNLSIPFAPCPGLCADMYQYCGPSLAQSAGCANTTAPTPMAPPPSAPAQSASDNTTAPAPAPSAGLPPGIPAELLPLLAAIQALPCATSPFNASIFTRECPPLLVDNVDDDDEGPCAVECPNPLFKYSERLGLSITITVMGTCSIFYTMFSFFAIMTHPIYRHFPKSAVGYMFFALHFIVWSDFIRLFYLGGEIDGIICVNRQNADFTHAVCGFQAVCLIVGLSGVLWWNVLVVNLFLAAYQLPKPEGVWNRVYHACCHLFIWPFNLTMICLIAGFGIISDGIISCAPDTTIWRGWMADAFFFIPFSLFELFGFFILTLVVLRILWVLRTKTLVKGASLRMIVFLGYGYLQTLYFLTFHFQYRIRNDAINETYTRYGTCLATTLPWLRDSQCHIDGDHFHYSELIVAMLLGALAQWVAFYTLMTKASMWAHWVWAFRVYILRQKDVKMPFEEVRRRQTVSRVSQRMSRSTGTQSASGTQSSTGFTMDMPE